MSKLINLMFAVILGACASTTIDFNKEKSLSPVEPTSNIRLSFFLGGLLPERESFNTTQLCGDSKTLQKAEVLFTGLDVFLNIITLNIYSPKTLRVWCI